eukprot:g8642.t1
MELSTSAAFSKKLNELRSRITNGLPETIECPIGREEQFKILQNLIHGCFTDKKGGAIYVSGLPGTGKSLTIHGVLRSLLSHPNSIKIPPVVVSVNCMVLPSPNRIHEVLLEAYNQHRMFDDPYQIHYFHQLTRTTQQRNAFSKLEDLINEEVTIKTGNEIRRPVVGKKRQKKSAGIDRGMIVVFLDEMDSLVMKDATLIKELFALAMQSHRLVLIGASNSLDLSEKLNSPSMPEMVTFPAYKAIEVATVLKTVFQECGEKILTDRGIEFLARKSATSGMGDMRNVFHICLSSLSSIDESEVTQQGKLIDVKDLMRIFQDTEELKTESSNHTIASLPLDQQILLLAIYHQSILSIEDSEEPPRKKLTVLQKIGLDPLNVVNIYQRYSNLCQALCMDCSSKADVSCMVNILGDLGFIHHEKRKKQILVKLKTSFETVKEFYTNSRLFMKML